VARTASAVGRFKDDTEKKRRAHSPPERRRDNFHGFSRKPELRDREHGR